MVAAIAPGFGGINLEDIAAPVCFQVEEALQAMLDIPVFHDDQHGTAVIVAAALQNALELQGKELGRARAGSTSGSGLASAKITGLGASASNAASGMAPTLGARAGSSRRHAPVGADFYSSRNFPEHQPGGGVAPCTDRSR